MITSDGDPSYESPSSQGSSAMKESPLLVWNEKCAASPTSKPSQIEEDIPKSSNRWSKTIRTKIPRASASHRIDSFECSTTDCERPSLIPTPSRRYQSGASSTPSRTSNSTCASLEEEIKLEGDFEMVESVDKYVRKPGGSNNKKIIEIMNDLERMKEDFSDAMGTFDGGEESILHSKFGFETQTSIGSTASDVALPEHLCASTQTDTVYTRCVETQCGTRHLIHQESQTDASFLSDIRGVVRSGVTLAPISLDHTSPAMERSSKITSNETDFLRAMGFLSVFIVLDRVFFASILGKIIIHSICLLFSPTISSPMHAVAVRACWWIVYIVGIVGLIRAIRKHHR